MARAQNILIVFHTPSNAGYAMSALERSFYEVALSITKKPANVHFAFSDLDAGRPRSLPSGFSSLFEINSDRLNEKKYFLQKRAELDAPNIDMALCFDLPPKSPLVNLLRESGVKFLASYWGASMSSVNRGPKLFLKKLEVLLAKARPDIFIFESEAMRYRATNGRGLSRSETTVIPTGVDADLFKPNKEIHTYVRTEFDIPDNRKIVIYSGHMEERKGVRVLLQAMMELLGRYHNEQWHMLVCGNRPGEEDQFEEILLGTKAEKFVTFAGYRDDLHNIMPGCDLGVIASTGWDSFPMSALEMAACGLPLVVSRLQGLIETIVENETGLLFEPGNPCQLASMLNQLSSDEDQLDSMAKSGRNRIEQSYSLSHQREKLKQTLLDLMEES